ncbi:MAG: S-layer homology domain-containing protein [Chloroflexia bacterium]
MAHSFVAGTTVAIYTVAVGGYTGSSTTATTEVSTNPASLCVTVTVTATAVANTATITATPVSGSPTATVCVPSSGWSPGPNPPVASLVRAVGVYFPPNGKFYTLGGRTSDAPGSDYQHVLEYTPGNPGTWVQKNVILPDNQTNNMACGVLTVGGTSYIYCVGGSAAGQATTTARVFFYDPVADAAAVLPSADNWPGDTNGTTLPGGFVVVSNKLYILGGFNINVSSTNQIYGFDPTAPSGSRWTLKTSVTPVGIMYAPTAAPGGLLYVTGASDYQGGTVIDTTTTFGYNPATDTIINTVATIPRATGETRALTVGNHIWVLGGGRVAPNPSNEVDICDPAGNTWSVGQPFTNARRSFPADTDGSTVWLAGGYEPNTPARDMEIFRPGTPCGTATATVQPVSSPTLTTQPVNSPTATTQPGTSPTPTTQSAPTFTPTAPPASTPTATATACTINFSDVHPADYFYTPVSYLACHGVVSGYGDGTFRPYANTTRSQMVKIVVLGFNKAIVTPAGTAYSFTDVPRSNPFFAVVETAYADGIVSGYNCGTAPAGPCDSMHRPYFLPFAYVTRGQLSKIDVIAAGWTLYNPAVGHFSDVAHGSVFYTVIETAYCHGVISGYNDGTFRPFNDAIRGQISKIVYLSIVTPPVSCGS